MADSGSLTPTKKTKAPPNPWVTVLVPPGVDFEVRGKESGALGAGKGLAQIGWETGVDPEVEGNHAAALGTQKGHAFVLLGVEGH